MNLKDTLESLIAQAMEDEQELIPTHELPAAKAIAARIEELEEALRECLIALESSTSNHEWNEQRHFDAINKAEDLLAQS